MNKFIKTVCILFMALLGMAAIASSEDDGPVALLIQPKGEVMYSGDGKTWKMVNRNHFLFEGWRVKTGADGFCKLVNNETGMIESVKGNTEIEILSQGIKAVKGTISAPEHSSSFMSMLKRKFAKVQKYAVIKRRPKDPKRIRLKTAKEITLSEDYPELVWENVGPEYSYRLVVGKKTFDVPASDRDMARFSLSGIEPGQFDYHVRVFCNGELVYKPGKKGRLHWMSDDEMESLRNQEEDIQQTDPDGFLLGNFMDDHGLKVPAMDLYRKFLSKNPDANNMRPFLLKVLSDLNLETLKKAELKAYHSQAE